MFFFSGPEYNPSTDIPSLSGKVILITGANGGLGYESLIHLVRHNPKKIFLCARTRAKFDAAMTGIKSAVDDSIDVEGIVKFLQLDLTSFKGIAKSVEEFHRTQADESEDQKLHILMNNAGIFMCKPSMTEDGYEVTFGVNHMGHALLTKLLLPTLQEAAKKENSDVRIINLSSEGHNRAPNPKGFDPALVATDMSDIFQLSRYGQSKLANVLYTSSLAQQYPSITSVSIHPGVVVTGLANQFLSDHPWLSLIISPIYRNFAKRTDVGAWNQTWAATAPVAGKPWTGKEGAKDVQNGKYYDPVGKLGQPSKFARDEDLQRQLWEWTQAELEKHGY